MNRKGGWNVAFAADRGCEIGKRSWLLWGNDSGAIKEAETPRNKERVRDGETCDCGLAVYLFFAGVSVGIIF